MAFGPEFMNKIVAASLALDRARAVEREASAAREQAERALQGLLQTIAGPAMGVTATPSPAAPAPAVPRRVLLLDERQPRPDSDHPDAPLPSQTGPGAELSPAAMAIVMTNGAMRDRVLHFLGANAPRFYAAGDIAPYIGVTNLDSLRTTLANLAAEGEIVRGEKGQYSARSSGKKEARPQ